jgi:hypothetical protein
MLHKDLTKQEKERMLEDPRVLELLGMIAEREDSEVTVGAENELAKMKKAVEENYTPKQIEEARTWVMRMFANMISGRAENKDRPKSLKPHIKFCTVLEGWDGKKKLTSKRRKKFWQFHHGVFVENFILYYIDVILDDDLMTDKDKVIGIVAKAKETPESGHYDKIRLWVNYSDPDNPKLELYTHDQPG